MRQDIIKIFNLIKDNSSILDLGCGDGELLLMLKNRKNSKVKGIDIDEKKVISCLEKGLPVYHGDIETTLPHYREKIFDYVIISLTLHQLKNPEKIIIEATRVGKNVIISFPNFGYWKIRFNIFFKGTIPSCDYTKYEWYSEKFVHFITVNDFENFCKNKKLEILTRFFLPEKFSSINPNFFAASAIYSLRRSII